MEATTPQSEDSHMVAHDYGTPADMEKNLPKEVSVVEHEIGLSPSSSERKESLESAFKVVLTGSHDIDGPPTHAVSVESLNCEVKEVSMVARGSAMSATKVGETSKLAIKDVSMVDSVMDNLVKVSIQRAGNSNEEHLQEECDNSGGNGKSSYSKGREACESVVLAVKKGDSSAEKVTSDEESLWHNAKVSEMQVESCKDNKLVSLIKDSSRPDSYEDANGDDDDSDDEDVDKSVTDEDAVEDEDEDEDDGNEGVEQESDESDSSSSTSTLVFSSSSDDEEADFYRLPNSLNQDLSMEAESECEEGELKEAPSQSRKTSVKKKVMGESSEDEGGLKEPVRSRNEMKDLPRVPKVSVTLQPHHTTVPAGFVSSVVGVSLIVEGIEGKQALSEGSILWLTEQRSPLGIVDELFGPVKKPFYVVRYNDTSELPVGAKEGAEVSYVGDFADFVLNNSDLYAKGFDNLGDNDEELSDSEVYFSDDEKEAEYKRSKPRMKRGNSELRTPDIDSRQHQERRTQGKRSGKDNRNQRSRGDNARNFRSNSDFLGRPPRHENPQFQHPQGERDLSFQRRQGERDSPYHCRQGEREQMEPMQKCNERQLGSQDQRNSSTPPRRAVSVSNEAGCFPQRQAQVLKTNQSPQPISQEVQPTQSNQSSQSTSWGPQPPQTNQSRSCMQPASPQQMNQSPDFMQSTSHKVHMNQALSAVQSTLQYEQTNLPNSFMQSIPELMHVNQPHSFIQPALQHVVPLQPQNHLQLTPQQGHMINQSPTPNHSQAWHMNQPLVSQHMVSSQLPGVQHSPMPLINTSVVVGQVPHVAGSGYGLPTTNNGPFQSGLSTGQGVLPMHQPPVFQPVPPQKHFSSFAAHQFPAQVSSNMSMQVGNQVQAAHVDGYPTGVQPASFTTPVLGIPVGSASAPSNYVVHNQHYTGFTPGCDPAYSNGSPLTFGAPDHPRPMQPMQPSPGTSAASWQQQNSPQGSTWQQPYQQQRPLHGRAPYRSPRF